VQEKLEKIIYVDRLPSHPHIGKYTKGHIPLLMQSALSIQPFTTKGSSSPLELFGLQLGGNIRFIVISESFD
jgi:hypothetical protein